MFDKMKYIVYDDGVADIIIVFPEFVQHADMAQRLGLKPTDLLSAGFVSSPPGGSPTCFGHSVGLALKSRDVDTRLLRKNLGWDEEDL